jgi:hypothetical protein
MTRDSQWVGSDSFFYNSNGSNLVPNYLPIGWQVYPGTNEVNSFIYELTMNVYDPEQLMSTAFRTLHLRASYSCFLKALADNGFGLRGYELMRV